MNIKAATALLLTSAPAIILLAQRIRRHRLDLGARRRYSPAAQCRQHDLSNRCESWMTIRSKLPAEGLDEGLQPDLEELPL